MGITELGQKEQTMDIFRKLLNAAPQKLTAGQRTRLQWHDGSVCCMLDAEARLLFCVVTSTIQYPENLAYKLLYDLQLEVQNSLQVSKDLSQELQDHCYQDVLETKMKSLVETYENSLTHQH